MKKTQAILTVANLGVVIARLTNRGEMDFTGCTSLLCVSTAGREAGSAEPALAFITCKAKGASRAA